ncbi:MAG TPA: GYD domain-containing protein [Chloroflexota bacterium]|nr:GYD domain-containing protein [Chloroflexota bacterium]
MPHYAFQGAYTAETWARLTKNPEDREAAIRAVCEKNGGKLVGLWFMFGSDDFLAVAELPNEKIAGAMGMAVAASGGYHNFRTTPLVSAADAMAMMRQANQLGFRPAGS